MTEQLTLIPEPRVRRTDPATSRAARDRVRPIRQTWGTRILESLETQGPATDDELCVRLNVDPRRWPSVKTARSAMTCSSEPLIAGTGEVRSGQQVWKRLFVEAVEVHGNVL